MKKWTRAAVAVATVIALLWLFSAVTGFFIRGAIVVGIGWLAFATVRGWWRERMAGPKQRRTHKRIEKSASKTIEELAKELDAARSDP